ncbi:PAS domain-containing protein [Cryptosporangium sp. NPDC048952]|uniref:PAS domain-containing protein n=1 Tax=Cryptosporangium sp. NPDC048952 TaxID=3363961 RepID=UPI00371E5EE6
MVVEDAGVLADPARLAAVDRFRRMLSAMPIPLEGTARLAARLLDAPMALITLVGDASEYFAGSFGAPESLVAGGQASAAYSVCKYIVSADAPVSSDDVHADEDQRIREHPLVTEYGVRAFLGVPLRDADDRPVGSLSVMDTRPRTWSDTHWSTLLEMTVLISQVPAAAPRTGTLLLNALDTTEVLDAIAEAFLTLDAEGVVTGWNTAARELFGFTATEACGQPVAELLAAEYTGRPVQHLATGLLTGQIHGPVSGPVTLRARDGRRIHAQARLTLMRGAGGRTVCVFLTDVTAQVAAAETAQAAAAQAEVDAEDQRGFAEALLDSLGEGVIAVDAEGRPVVFNRALRELHGLPADMPLAQARTIALPRLHHPDGTPIDRHDLAVTHALGGRTIRDEEVLIREPGRPDRYMLASAQPVLGRYGRPIGAVTTVQDITERRRAEQIRNCELTIANILNQPGTLTELAPALLRTTARTLGWPCLTLGLIDSTTDSLRILGQWAAEGYDLHGLIPDRFPRSNSGLLATVWATGQPAWVPDLAAAQATNPQHTALARAYLDRGLRAMFCAPIRDGDEVLGMLSGFAGTTETDDFLPTGLLTAVAAQIGQFLARRRAEDLARELAGARADFTALIGHDMRTPLTTIATYTEYLLDDPAPRPDTDRQLLEGIDRNATTLRELLEGLLDLAALESGHHALDTRTLDLSTVLARACDAAATAAAASCVDLHPRIRPDVTVTGDPDRLRQLADTLLATAITASASGGDLQAALEQADGAVQLTITAPAHIDSGKAFRRFSEANTSGTGDTATPGMSLLLCRVIAERHGGTLTLTDDAESTTVTVRLPQPTPNSPA